ncbi:hypothetical protein ACYTFC_03205 [Streptomyces globosus]|uniref:hypothetical protein n=1 Tax=Streptomyces sp. WAC05292 TaxID=2487418 RepID=UPI000F73879B|nr:hypothetical protein [Streptomyces sp. WAC05292]RSS95258.1 hypothetical protein EF903_05085 [Streptomyces sp. WAC05292]
MALGLVGPLAEKWDYSVCAALSIVFSSGWPWACYALLVGYFRRRKTESALLASVGLAIGVVAYYLFKDIYPTIPAGTTLATSIPAGMEVESSGPEGQMFVWGTAAFVFGAPLGLIGNVARTPGVGGLLFRLLAPLIAFFEANQRLHVESESQGPLFAWTWNTTRVAACVAALALVGHTVWRRRVRRSRASGQTEAAAPAQRP